MDASSYKCKDCSSQDFEMGVDGLFCKSCNLTVVGSVQEQTDAIASRKNVLGSSSIKEGPSDTDISDTDKSDTGKSNASSCTDSPGLTINQAYNLIIFKQVSALIDLGASEKMKNVVFFIWSKYIQKCETVSMNESESHKTKVHENKKKSKGKIGRNKQKAKEINTKKGIKKIEMSLPKTLCFCYLGLLYTNDQLLLSDLLRLANEERVPFFNAHELVQDQLDNTVSSRKFSTMVIPDVHEVSLQCAKLIHFLQLPKFKHRSLMPIVLRFVKDLNLPENIVHIVKMLIDKLDLDEWYEFDPWKKMPHALPVYEVQAISLIIIVLKMFFVLDGEYELDHSQVSRKINILLQDRKLFVWDQWKQQASLKEFLFMNQKFEFRKISFFDSLKTSQIVSKYKLISRPSLNSSCRSYKNLAENRLQLAEIFNELRSRNKIPERPTPTSFPLTQSLIEFLDRAKDLPMYKETKEFDFSLLTEDFSSALLFYLPSEKDKSSQEIIDFLCSTLYKHVPEDKSNIASSNYWLCTSSNYWSNKIHPDNLKEVHAWLNNFSPSFEWLVRFLSNYVYSKYKHVYLEVVKMEKKFVVHTRKVKKTKDL